MFRLVDTLTCWWPVTVYEPDPGKPGAFAEYSFEAELEILDRDAQRANADERDAILLRAQEDPSEAKLKAANRELDEQEKRVLRRIVKNWRNVVGEDGQPLPFSNEAFDRALARQAIREGFNVAYAEAIDTGKARQGNSKPRP